jgi:hypothetical protein
MNSRECCEQKSEASNTCGHEVVPIFAWKICGQIFRSKRGLEEGGSKKGHDLGIFALYNNFALAFCLWAWYLEKTLMRRSLRWPASNAHPNTAISALPIIIWVRLFSVWLNARAGFFDGESVYHNRSRTGCGFLYFSEGNTP